MSNKTPRAAAPVSAEPVKTLENKSYYSTQFTVLFDVQVNSETVYGFWGERGGKRVVEFSVAPEQVEGFEKHYHFAVGNIVAVEPAAPAPAAAPTTSPDAPAADDADAAK